MERSYLDFLSYDYSVWNTVLTVSLVAFSLILARYFLISWAYEKIFRKPSNDARKLVKSGLNKAQTRKEIGWAIISALIFTVFTMLLIIGRQHGIFLIYIDINEYPLWWIPAGIVLILLLHEAYYYWLHRWMHLPGVYRLVHKTHHESVQTSVYTAFSFHPIESLLQAIYLPLVLTFIPVNLFVLIGLLVLMTISATVNHAGIEVFPSGAIGQWMGKWLVGSTHHHVHHTKFRYNFGLYFTFWDKLMKTENQGFQDEFNSIISDLPDQGKL
ncbi:sterol desaturase family protein [Fulvivirga sedimenti]|uniref:Sterol desaturase family protein n=1 Tax=Fulvivirga sedimenti TaxID=2879465 RepID=A0A9X1HP74_9BACT|nr:sterol desaturase family protein [Fulvivirga sedimenti]MCA6073657.1 sterol desaturase family protein [Fulvivirga sedimenti]